MTGSGGREDEQRCAACGGTNLTAEGECLRCGLELATDGEAELELDWGDRKRPDARSDDPPSAAAEPVSPTDDVEPQVDLDTSNFPAFIRVTDLVLLVGMIFEFASGALSLAGALLRNLGAASTDSYLPSSSRGLMLFVSVVMSVMWTFLVLRLLRPRAGLAAEVASMWLLPFLRSSRASWAELTEGLARPPRWIELSPAALLTACLGWLGWATAVKLGGLAVSPAGLMVECLLAFCAALAFARLRGLLRAFHAERELSRSEEPSVEPAPPPAPLPLPVTVRQAPPAPVPVSAAPAAPAALSPPAIAGPAALAVSVPCLACGATIALTDATCSICRTKQLFDVVASSVGEEKARYALARQLAALGVPGLAFKEALERLKRPRPIVATRLARSAALRLVDTLVAHRCPAKLVLHVKPRSAGRLGLQVAVAAVALAWVGFSFPRRPQDTETLAALARKSTVTVHCPDSLGSGFLIARDLVVTNEHVACSKMTVLFADGRKLAATLRVFDDWLDLAVLDVPGAGDVALELGDATRLREGSPVVMVGAPRGLSFSVHQGIISHVGRTRFGISYLQFDGSVNPGNSGGPLLDADGKVVGIVSMRMDESEGLGFALPVNYLRDARLVPPELVTAPSRSWTALLELARESERRELEAVRANEQRTEVVRLVREGVVVSTRSEQQPPQRGYELVLENGGRRACAGRVSSSEWKPVEFEQAHLPQLLRWLQKNALLDGLYVAVVPLINNCTANAQAGSEIVLVDGATELFRMPLE